MRRAVRVAALLALIGLVALSPPSSAKPKRTSEPKPPTLTFVDPTGDDHGPGGYVYPTDAAFSAGAFDLREVSVDAGRRTVTVRIRFARPITDPWASSTWGGCGFSLQLVHVYLATERPPKRRKAAPVGYDTALPGIHARFADVERWDRAVLVSAEEPRAAAKRVKGLKKGYGKRDIIVPDDKQLAVEGDTLVVTLPRRAFGKRDPKTWGVQVVVGSTDFYVGTELLLSRPVNARAGAFRFGGGHDGQCDPNVLDLLDSDDAPQKKQLAWRCDVGGAGMATLSLLHR